MTSKTKLFKDANIPDPHKCCARKGASTSRCDNNAASASEFLCPSHLKDAKKGNPPDMWKAETDFAKTPVPAEYDKHIKELAPPAAEAKVEKSWLAQLFMPASIGAALFAVVLYLTELYEMGRLGIPAASALSNFDSLSLALGNFVPILGVLIIVMLLAFVTLYFVEFVILLFGILRISILFVWLLLWGGGYSTVLSVDWVGRKIFLFFHLLGLVVALPFFLIKEDWRALMANIIGMRYSPQTLSQYFRGSKQRLNQAAKESKEKFRNSLDKFSEKTAALKKDASDLPKRIKRKHLERKAFAALFQRSAEGNAWQMAFQVATLAVLMVMTFLFSTMLSGEHERRLKASTNCEGPLRKTFSDDFWPHLTPAALDVVKTKIFQLPWAEATIEAGLSASPPEQRQFSDTLRFHLAKAIAFAHGTFPEWEWLKAAPWPGDYGVMALLPEFVIPVNCGYLAFEPSKSAQLAHLVHETDDKKRTQHSVRVKYVGDYGSWAAVLPVNNEKDSSDVLQPIMVKKSSVVGFFQSTPAAEESTGTSGDVTAGLNIETANFYLTKSSWDKPKDPALAGIETAILDVKAVLEWGGAHAIPPWLELFLGTQGFDIRYMLKAFRDDPQLATCLQEGLAKPAYSMGFASGRFASHDADRHDKFAQLSRDVRSQQTQSEHVLVFFAGAASSDGKAAFNKSLSEDRANWARRAWVSVHLDRPGHRTPEEWQKMTTAQQLQALEKEKIDTITFGQGERASHHSEKGAVPPRSVQMFACGYDANRNASPEDKYAGLEQDMGP